MIRLLAGLALILPLAAYGGFDEGVDAYSVGDYGKALAEFKPLAEQGDVNAQYFVGFLYHYGYGVQPDQTESAKWFRQAAEQGDPRSRYYLGKMYEKGDGVERSLIDAYLWLTLSAASSVNSRDAAYTREDISKLERRMTPEQLTEAKDKAKQWKPTK